MAAEQPNNIKKPLCAGLLAHVDAGKTTLSEAMLYESGARRTLGRVDHQDAFLDTHALERARGITIFSKQALLETEHRAVTLVDTPGHVDFSAEAERIMPVLDCAVLVISGTDGVQAHTLTLWRLLERYQVPTFLFLNKMDLPGMGKEKLLAELRQQIDRLDDELLALMAKRMRISREIGQYKKEHSMPILQAKRYDEILNKRGAQAVELGINPEFVKTLLQAIHEESVHEQVKVING